VPHFSHSIASSPRRSAAYLGLLFSAIGCAGSDDGGTLGNNGAQGGAAGSNVMTSAGAPPAAGSAGTSGAPGASTGGTELGSGAGMGGQPGSSGSSAGSGGSAGSMAGANAGGTGGGAPGGSGGAASAADCSSLKLCEDFEHDALDAGTWTLPKAGAFTATLETSQAHSGTRALHVVAPNTVGSAFITETKGFPAADFWGRAWLRFHGPEGGHQVYIIANSPGDQLRLLNRRNGSEAVAINVQKTDRWYSSKTLIPQDTWFCYEWHVTTSAISIYINGKKQALKMGTNGDAPGITGGTALLLGFQRFTNSSSDGEVWYDDVAVGDTQIGCQ